MRKICVVTGTRAEYGLLQNLMVAIDQCDDLALQVVVSAAHLSPEFGMTVHAIEADGFCISDRVEMLLSGDSACAVTKSLGLGTIGFADSLRRLEPDLMVLLGDRFEALAAAQAAMLAGVPIAHIHGGEITEGAVDESIRHAITKMAHLHFVATQAFRKRVIQLGEQPERVYVSGAPGIDNIVKMALLDQPSLEQSLGFTLGNHRVFLITYHPLTLAIEGQTNSMEPLFDALDHFSDVQLIITYPNADTAGRELIRSVEDYASSNPGRVHALPSLGQLRYLSLLRHVDLVIGNSSSGLIEVPSFGIPTINIGDRQKGRLKAESVIDCPADCKSIVGAIERGLDAGFREGAASVVNPYGAGEATERILEVLRTCDPDGLKRKPFYDVSFEV